MQGIKIGRIGANGRTISVSRRGKIARRLAYVAQHEPGGRRYLVKRNRCMAGRCRLIMTLLARKSGGERKLCVV
ncbi:MAG: hypothetical protein WCK07_10660 [Betaproteobacteria bacterium]